MYGQGKKDMIQIRNFDGLEDIKYFINIRLFMFLGVGWRFIALKLFLNSHSSKTVTILIGLALDVQKYF